ncbi:DUF2986 domain-containing protein [Shewanella sp. JM162201]|uniref:DUF2986 domain-containing protein n=1 Tax=Shewanella jiangmenensis TaxID=2837387 RepID=A0ABS5V5P3_9GAMM|nr:DUF2986 domain-containing protein [Shewanella jiangmenensis]MBT1445769.1 DUF2986 domain-containing protein [Shewanella jiangmenensis]
MNRKQALIKKMAKRTKARENKKEHPNHGAKDRYISKADRAKLEAAELETAELKTAEPGAAQQSASEHTAAE